MTKKKKTPDNTKDIRDLCVRVALDLAAEQDWSFVDFDAIAQKADIDASDVEYAFDDKSDLLRHYGRMIDLAVLENLGATSEDPVRDRLFDLLMERFDILNKDRAAILSIMISIKSDPKEILFSAPALCKSSTRMLEASGVDTSGLTGMLKISGLSALMLNAMRIWIKDMSDDMSKTMAAIDKDLGRAEQIINTLHLGERRSNEYSTDTHDHQ